MGSNALAALVSAVEEVQHLISAAPRVRTSPLKPNPTVRVIGRASVVLLASHFERYIYAVNEEAVGFINSCGVSGDALPEQLRLVHSKAPFDEIENTSWERRATQLAGFVASDAWLWRPALAGALDHKRLLAWMKAPKPKNLVRYYKYWGIDDVFAAVTRKRQTKYALELKVKEFVDKRNNIAHGDFSDQATRLDIRRYSASALVFCRRADGVLSRALSRLSARPAPW